MYEIIRIQTLLDDIENQAEITNLDVNIFYSAGRVRKEGWLTATVIVPDLETMNIRIHGDKVMVNRIFTTFPELRNDLTRIDSWLQMKEEANGAV